MSAEGVWIKVAPNSEGRTDTFKCSNCGMLSTAVMDTFCDYPYCPWCRAEMVETEGEDDAAD